MLTSKPCSLVYSISFLKLESDVVMKINTLVTKELTGIYQLSGNQDISYFEFAKNFVLDNGYSEDLVKGCSYLDKLTFNVPRYTSMLNV